MGPAPGPPGPGLAELPPWATAAVRIVPYDPGWPGLAGRFTAELVPALAPWRLPPVEHVGSTAVPGLAARLMALVAAKDEAVAAAGPALAILPTLS
jgi:GrpB-like predicted nucleotidyltransferase (UPF0157 family)